MYLQSRMHLRLYVLLFLAVVSGIGATAVSGQHNLLLYAAPADSRLTSAPNADGAIAYVAGGAIWLINANGTNPRRIWQLPDPAAQQITGVDWSPDGTRLAFAADHESTCSLYRSDIYSINIDGTDLRRLTNSPVCAELANFPKGSVQVTIKNNLTESLFLLYVEGAANAVEVTIPPLTSDTITVDNVADFGDGVQQQFVVFQTDQKNWVNGAVTVDVEPDMTTAASADFLISNGTSFTTNVYGANHPSWRRDGQAIAFSFGNASGRQIAANPTVAQPSTPLFPDGSIFASQLDLSPVDERVLLYNYPFISVGNVGDDASVNNILEMTGNLYGMDWLTDGSGLVGGELLGVGNTHANLWRYTLDSMEIANLTNFDDENRGYAADPSVSPDGTALVFIYAPTIDADAELQIMDMDGGNVRSLGVNGLYPVWGIPGQISQPTPTPTQTSTQTPEPTATSVSQPTPSPSPTATNGPQPTPVPTLDPAEVTDEIYLPVVQR